MPGPSGMSGAGGMPLLERSDQLRALRQSLATAGDGGGGRVVLLSGEAGIGKTALLREFCRVAGGKARVLWAGCEPLFTPRPLGPLRDLAMLTGGPLAARGAEDAGSADVAIGLLNELRRGGAAVLVLEDMHWADEATLDVIRFLSRRIEQVPGLLALSYRDDQLGRDHRFRVVLGDLAGADTVIRVELAGLSEKAVATLARPLAGPAAVSARELHQRTAGNPFFVTEVLAAGTRHVPASVRDAILARAAQLDAAARGVLDAIAVVPGSAEMWLVQALVPDSAEPLDRCLDAGMIVTAGDRVMFRHDIARQAMEESMPLGRRAALHRAALAALARQAAPDPARLVHHAEAAGDADAVLRYAPIAAERADAAGALRAAGQLYSTALRFAGGLEPAQRADLLVRYADTATFTGLAEEAIAALREAVDIYQECGDQLRQGDALRRLAGQLGAAGDHVEAQAAIAGALALLEQVPPSPELARTYNVLAALLGVVGDDQAVAWAERAIKLAERIGCLDAIGDALNVAGTAELMERDLGGLAKIDRSREVARKAGDEQGVARTYVHPAAVFAAQREWVQAEPYLVQGLAFCRERGLDGWWGWMAGMAGEAALARGSLDDAADIATAILDSPVGAASFARGRALLMMARLKARRGDAGYEDLLEEAAAVAKASPFTESMMLIAVARAEAAWLEGASPDRIGEVILSTTGQATPAELRWYAGEREVWRHRAGMSPGAVARLAEPYRLEIAGDHEGAAIWWLERGCSHEAAMSLACSSDQTALRRALEMLTELGAHRAVSVVARRLRALGEVSVPRGPRPTTAANPAGLTGREVEVLALIAGGLSNSAIAARLTLSGRTVDNHVSAIFRKLGVQTREQASEQANRLGIDLHEPPGKIV
jgi:DNA-binding CsgD family transcriptional regulator/tetratricopeptide (TPR) repeat protein